MGNTSAVLSHSSTKHRKDSEYRDGAATQSLLQGSETPRPVDSNWGSKAGRPAVLTGHKTYIKPCRLTLPCQTSAMPCNAVCEAKGTLCHLAWTPCALFVLCDILFPQQSPMDSLHRAMHFAHSMWKNPELNGHHAHLELPCTVGPNVPTDFPCATYTIKTVLFIVF